MIDILFCGNDKVFDGALTTMLSIFKRTKTEEPFRFFIYTMDVSHINPAYKAFTDGQIKFLDGVAKKYNPEKSVVKIDVGEIYKKEFSGCPNEQCYCSPYTLLRLFADLVPDMPDKILYLDIDLLFMSVKAGRISAVTAGESGETSSASAESSPIRISPAWLVNTGDTAVGAGMRSNRKAASLSGTPFLKSMGSTIWATV